MTSTLDYTAENGYITLPLTVDSTTLFNEAVAYIATVIPGWVPREGHIEVAMLEQFAAMVAESASVAVQVPLAIFEYFGANLVNLPPKMGAYAMMTSTWTMDNALGYTIPANTVVAYQALGNELYLFQTVTSFTISPGQSVATGIVLESQVVGTTFNGVPTNTDLEMVTALPYVQTVVTTTGSLGGADAETTTAYLDRLSNELQLLTPRPILPQDFAVLAQNVAGVYRSTAFNLLNPFANQFTAADASFGSAGSWVAVSGAATSLVTGPGGEPVLQITGSSGSTANAVVSTGYYPASQNTGYLFLATFDVPTSPATLTLSAQPYDVNNNPIGSPIVATGADNTGAFKNWLFFTTPANTTQVKLIVTVDSINNTLNHYMTYTGLFLASAAPTNYVPDSSIQNSALTLPTWSTSSGAWATAPFVTNVNSWQVTGTGSAQTTTSTSNQFLPPAGSGTVSVYIDATHVTSGQVKAEWKTPGGAALATLLATSGTAQWYATGITTVGTSVNCFFATNGATIANGLLVTFAEPQLIMTPYVSGVPAYTQGPTWGAAGLLTNNERTITVACCDVNGNALTSTIEANIASYLASLREVNFVVNVIPPSYTGIDISYTAYSTPTANAGTVATDITAALTSYLSPGNWAGGDSTPPYWDPTQTTVHYSEVAAVIAGVTGVAYVSSLQIGLHGSTLGTSDVAMVGYAPLPANLVTASNPGNSTITGQVIQGTT